MKRNEPNWRSNAAISFAILVIGFGANHTIAQQFSPSAENSAGETDREIGHYNNDCDRPQRCPRCGCGPYHGGCACDIAPSDVTRGSRLPDIPISPETQAQPIRLGPAVGIAAAGTSALPYVMGDNAFGSCASFRFGELQGEFAHPALVCSRINLAENNSPLPRDRVFTTWRHFEDAIPTNMFGAQSTLDVDRVTFGIERTMLGGMMSMEFRMPFNVQLASNSSFVADLATPANSTNFPITQEAFELGNASFALKAVLYQSDVFAFTGGFGLLLPTARAVQMRGQMVGTFDTDDDGTITTTDANAAFVLQIENSTVDIAPFLGFIYNPGGRLFAQGFMQVDLPLNSSNAGITFTGDLDTGDAAEDNGAAFTTLHAQALMRVNSQLGYWIIDDPGGVWLDRLAALFEVHYTTTLQNANIAPEAVILGGGQLGGVGGGTAGVDDITFRVGNFANRVDIVNLGFATAVERGLTRLTTGLVIPVTTGDNQPFNWELNVLVNRNF
ncbi:MAG: hypothetical protein MI865_07785 [Proteobacteria bacterium]|nr:hypothetical protein [Pseudomonadota bacterium]